MTLKERLDVLMVRRGLVGSREAARALVMEGKVSADGSRVSKAGTSVRRDAEIVIAGPRLPYVSRGGLKLQAAIDHFGIDPSGKVVMDIGCSTGGFTDCVLQRNARKVFAVDVGYGQFDWSLRNDPRVVLIEKTNIRHLDASSIPDRVDLVLIDVSFISLTKVLPKVHDLLEGDAEVLALIKPQFEVGKGMVGKGGIVRDAVKREQAVESIRTFSAAGSFTVLGLFESPVPGQKGNREHFIYLRRSAHGRTENSAGP